MARGLTKRQAAVLRMIIRCIQRNGMPPTIAEIGEHFGITSTNGVNDHLRALERKGYITRSSKARSIKITDKAASGLYTADVAMVPVVGRIAAGLPIFAEENVAEHIPLSANDYPGESCFALKVQGDSMIDDGILDGDTIIVNPSARVRQGDVVVAMVDDEVTVKRFFRHGEMVELRPANEQMEPMLFPGRRVSIQGIVTALHRTVR